MSRLRVVNGAAILRADPASAPAVSEALIEGASAATYLSFLQHDWADGEADSVILAISRGADASLRLASVWYVAGRLLMNAKVSDDILRGLSAAPSPGANWENFGRELMARQLDPRRDRGAWHPVVETGGPAADSIAVFADSPLFTKKERSALRKRRSAAGKGDARIPWSGLTSKVSAGPSTVRWPVPGLATDLLRVTGCRVPEWEHGSWLVYVDYQPSGLVERTSGNIRRLSPECQLAVFTAVRLHSRPFERRSNDERQAPVFVSFEPEALACQAGWPVDRGRAATPHVGPNAQVTAPTKTRHIDPVYPDEALNYFVQGTVVIEATVSPTGCIAEATVTRGVRGLDEAALEAVTRWQYLPAFVDGVPSGAIATVSADFRLKP